MWAVGVVLYEMLTGQLPFQGTYEQALFYAILNTSPTPISENNPHVPQRVQQCLERALTKDPNIRYDSIMALLEDLNESQVQEKYSSDDPSDTHSSQIRDDSPEATTGFQLQRFTLYGILFISVLLVMGGLAIWNPFSTFSDLPPRIVSFTSLPGSEIHPTFSPDGKEIVYAWDGLSGNNYDLYVKRIGTVEQHQLTDHPGHEFNPSWSPDGRYIAFQRYYQGQYTLHLIPSRGGHTQELPFEGTGKWFRIIMVNHPKTFSWTPDGRYLLSSFWVGDAYRIVNYNLQNHQVDSLTNPVNDIAGDTQVALAPSGTQLAFVRRWSIYSEDIYVQPYPSGTPHQLTFDSTRIAGLTWSPDGHEIIYSSNKSGRYEFWRISVPGGISHRVQLSGPNTFYPSVARAGRSLAFTQQQARQDLYRFHLPGSEKQGVSPIPFISSSRTDDGGDISPDGSQVVFNSRQSGYSEIWIGNLEEQYTRRLTTFSGPVAASPTWSPDGQSIAFDCNLNGQWDLYVIRANGQGLQRMTTHPSLDAIPY